MFGRLATAAIAAAALVAVALPGASAVASTTQTKCGAFAVLITVRGVDAPAGSNLQNGRVWLTGGNGAQLDPLVAKMKAAPYPVWTESLAWDASMSSNDFYAARVNQGMNVLALEIKSIIDTCKSSGVPHIFLAGHSGGADIVTRTLWYFSDPNSQRYIDGAVVYGDPSTSSIQNWNAKGVSQSVGVFHRPDSQTSAINATFRHFGWSFDNPAIQNPAYYPDVRAYCNDNDWACRNPIAYAWNDPAHNNYTGKTTDAYNWPNYLITDSN